MISRLEGIFFSPKCIYFVHLTTLSRSTLSALCLPHSTKEFLILWEWNCKAKMSGRKRQGQAVELESCVSSLVKVTVSSKQRPIKLWNKLLEQTGRLARAALRATSGTNTEQDWWHSLLQMSFNVPPNSQEPSPSPTETLHTRKAHISGLTLLSFFKLLQCHLEWEQNSVLAQVCNGFFLA